MKTLFLLRHAKSDWADHTLPDCDRPLNQRGRRDAPRMGRLLQELGLVPDLIVSSTAVRAMKTARYVAKHSGFDGPLHEEPSLYSERIDAYLRVVRSLDDPTSRALLVGHNPTMQMLIETLAGRLERMPTAALARLDLPLDRWSQVGAGCGRLAGIWRPRDLEVD